MGYGLSEALQLARKMEMDGIEFYNEAADRAGNPQAQRFFLSLAGDESRHLEVVENIARGMGVDMEQMPTPAENIQTVFSDADVQFGPDAQVTAQESDAIETALEMERDSYRL